MFGIKKVQSQLASLDEGLTQLVSFMHEKEMQTSNRLKRMEENLTHQKLELSSIKAKFHDLGEKVAKIDQILLKNDEFSNKSSSPIIAPAMTSAQTTMTPNLLRRSAFLSLSKTMML